MRTMRFVGSLLVGLLGSSLVFAGPFDNEDRSAQVAAKFVEDLLGEQWKTKVLAEFPGAQISFGSRAVLGGSATSSGYVVFAEVQQPNKEPAYYYFEVVITNVNNTPELAAKYGIETS